MKSNFLIGSRILTMGLGFLLCFASPDVGRLSVIKSLDASPSIRGGPIPQDFDHHALQAEIDRVIEKVGPACVSVRPLDARGVPVMSGFSAVIVSPEGHLLTAGHAVVPDADYQIDLPDGRKFAAKGKGKNASIDCGMIKITNAKEDLPYAKMGWAVTLQPNQPCISIGHPGMPNAKRSFVVRFGRISKAIAGNGMIQDSCLMEPGDSGGPLFDLDGNIIGIHSNIGVPLELNHEVSIDHFRRLWPQLNEPKVFCSKEVWGTEKLGIEMSPGRGLRVTGIEEGGFADAAGFEEYDRIVELNGETVRGKNGLSLRLFQQYVLEKRVIEFTVKRDGDREKLTVELPESFNYDIPEISKKVCTAAPGALGESIDALTDLPNQFSDIENRLDDHCVTVKCQIKGKTLTSLATIVSTEGHKSQGSYFVCKNSRVCAEPVVELVGADALKAKVVARDLANDLVLLKTDRTIGPSIQLTSDISDDIADCRGQFLLTPNPKNSGRISVWGSAEFESIRDKRGFLGVMPVLKDGDLTLTTVMPKSPAQKAGMKVGDVVRKVGGKPIDSAKTFIKLVGAHAPGDRVVFVVVRDGKKSSIEVELSVRETVMSASHAASQFSGGVSKRKSGFAKVFTHDAWLLPDECGGPVFDLNGRFVGVNIARHSRTQCYVIPARVIEQFVEQSIND